MRTFDKLVDPLLLSVSKQDEAVRSSLAEVVPSNVMEKIVFFRVEGGRLRVTVTSAAWITRLRFCEQQIVSTLRAKRYDVHTVSWHVAGMNPSQRVTKRKANLPSKSGETSLLSAAKTISTEVAADDELAKQLVRLSQNITKYKA